jgi:hypothetical protein
LSFRTFLDIAHFGAREFGHNRVPTWDVLEGKEVIAYKEMIIATRFPQSMYAAVCPSSILLIGIQKVESFFLPEKVLRIRMPCCCVLPIIRQPASGFLVNDAHYFVVVDEYVEPA